MNQLKYLAFVAAMATSGAMAADTVNIANVVELSGGGASNGVNWRDGLRLAADEINGKGGILGKQIKLTDYDTQTNPGVPRAQVQKALDSDPYVIMGPIYSGSVQVNMILAQRAGVPQCVGAQATEITHQGNPYVFRANMAQNFGMAKIADYMKTALNVKKVAVVWVNNAFGKGGRDALETELKARAMSMVADLPIEYGQADQSVEIQKAKNSGADAVFGYMTAEDAARFLKEARKQNIQVPLVGETVLLNQAVVELAGAAANGAICHLTLTADAPLPLVQEFRKKFEARFKYTPDHNALSSYMAMYVVKHVTGKIGKFDRKAFADTLHGLTITTKEEPGILMDSTWDQNGDVIRASFLGEGRDGKVVVTKVLPKN